MQDVYLDHLSEDVLERYFFRNSSGDESEIVEDHVLACEDCIARLENLECYVAVFRAASNELTREARLRAKKQTGWRSGWFSHEKLAWASVAALLFMASSFIPGFTPRPNAAVPIGVSVSAWRGVDIATVAAGRPLDLRLNSTDLPAGAVLVQLVDSTGSEIWHEPASVHDESVAVLLPALNRRDNYFVRLYSVGSNGKTYGDLLREFGIRAK